MDANSSLSSPTFVVFFVCGMMGRLRYDNKDSNWVEYDIDVNRKFYYENIPFNF